MSTIEEYRGSNNWEGLIPAKAGPDRIWDEGFRAFLIKYGMLNHVVYDVFIKGEDNAKDEQGLRGTSRFKDDLASFSEHGLEFSYVTRDGQRHTEYDFSTDYDVIGNVVCSPRSVFGTEDNWFGFISLSKDKTEMVIIFRGTETNAEWIENATMRMEQLDGEPAESGLALLFNRQNLMCHVGFQQMYRQEASGGHPSPKDSVHAAVMAHKDTIKKVTVGGHSLGGAMAQMCAIDLAYSKPLGDVPILCIAWAAPKIGNRRLADWVKAVPHLRILRIVVPLDSVTQAPPNWLWTLSAGGYMHLGTEISLSNAFMHDQKIVKADDGNSPNHNLEMYLHNVDPSRDIALMNKVGSVIPDATCVEKKISPQWHSLTFPRTIYHK